MAGREQGRNALRLGGAGEIDAGLLAAQPNVAEDQVDLLALEDLSASSKSSIVATTS
jgi:hypothetical protein